MHALTHSLTHSLAYSLTHSPALRTNSWARVGARCCWKKGGTLTHCAAHAFRCTLSHRAMHSHAHTHCITHTCHIAQLMLSSALSHCIIHTHTCAYRQIMFALSHTSYIYTHTHTRTHTHTLSLSLSLSDTHACAHMRLIQSLQNLKDIDLTVAKNVTVHRVGVCVCVCVRARAWCCVWCARARV